jgi:hypothetical protein
MSRRWDDEQLDRLIRSARLIKPAITDVEAGFEDRLAVRLTESRSNGVSLAFWTWRLAPVMTAVLLLLIVANIVIGTPRPLDVMSAVAGNDEYSWVEKYLSGD